ncbi:MAG: WXG100 family type VII secretion target [Clostridiales bacterium]|nr:WXG100 family type VII secretion target [Clostridiales bacterium]
MAKIRVTPEELGTASQKLAEMSNNYSEISKQLLQEASNMGAAWEGADNQAFVQQITGMCNSLQKMAEKLAEASAALDKQKNNYQARLQANIDAIKKLAN